MSDMHSFTTGPKAGEGQPWTALVLADWGWENSTVRGPDLPVAGLEANWSATLAMELIQARAADAAFVWVVGDIGYSDDAFLFLDEGLLAFQYEQVQDGFMGAGWMGSVAATTPTMVTVGNHEVGI